MHFTITVFQKISMLYRRAFKIFFASSAELAEERGLCIELIAEVNKNYKHLHLEPVQWELDTVRGNVPGQKTIQHAINPKLEESDVVVFLFFSKIGQYTKEEFDLANQKNQKLFVYFKKYVLPPGADEKVRQQYNDLLQFEKKLHQTVLHQTFEGHFEFKYRLTRDLHLYLSEIYPVSSPPDQFSEMAVLFSQELLSKRDEIERLKASSAGAEAVQRLLKEKEEIEQQLLQKQEFVKKLEVEKEVLLQQLEPQTKYDELKRKASEQIQIGNLEKAATYLQMSATEAKYQSAAVNYELAKLKALQLQYREAFEYYVLAAELHPKSSVYLNEAGGMAFLLGKYSDAIRFCEQALKLDVEYYGEIHALVATKYNNLGQAYDALGYYNQAISYFGKSLAIRHDLHEPPSPPIGSTLNNLGAALENVGELDNAIKHYYAALEMDSRFFDEKHPKIAIRYNNLGSAYYKKKAYDTAIGYYEKALTIDKDYYGEKHPSLAAEYSNLGLVYTYNRKCDKAIDYFNKGLSVTKPYYGDNHPQVGSIYNNLGLAYHYKGNYALAIEYYKRSLEIITRFFPPQHPNIRTTQESLRAAKDSLSKQNT